MPVMNPRGALVWNDDDATLAAILMSAKQVDENTASALLGLEAPTVQEIWNLVEHIKIEGDRYDAP
ncbi:NADP-dependent oxidoreductase domain-containing protein [Penicillium canariense]|uniref:NADP-dependent oxidoreductase domain-containing protein n=1 Tax=Penicillium canariense TaxID=189055 RepID=A0A9W9IFS0_9EURO|nr:NADP-dependent oxidoreductase domain-containing protein [Penicillium canariense]KAJ5175424.1 NADP-dependent oxidoreductase domain-containing protein [Penicillium canariense]